MASLIAPELSAVLNHTQQRASRRQRDAQLTHDVPSKLNQDSKGESELYFCSYTIHFAKRMFSVFVSVFYDFLHRQPDAQIQM